MAQKAPVIDMHAAAQSAILNKARALGNTKRGLKEVASDLINREGRKHLKRIAEGCFLSKQTVARVADADENYRPQADTLERVFRYFNAEIHFEEVMIKGRYQNKPKE